MLHKAIYPRQIPAVQGSRLRYATSLPHSREPQRNFDSNEPEPAFSLPRAPRLLSRRHPFLQRPGRIRLRRSDRQDRRPLHRTIVVSPSPQGPHLQQSDREGH
nr:hypothetical protein SHINE37_70044 [Rhizobiaceae bacterium]